MLFHSLPGKWEPSTDFLLLFFPQLPLGTYRHTDFALLLVFQAYYDSDVDVFTWGTPVTAIALFTFLLHLGIETKTWVRAMGKVTLGKGLML